MIRKIILVILTLATAGTFALLIDSHRTHYRSDKPAWSVAWGTHNVLVYRTVARAIVPPRSTWGDTPGRVGIVIHDVARTINIGRRNVVTTSKRISFVGIELFTGGSLWSLELSLWYLIVLLGVYPTMALARGPLRRYRRRKRGLCVTCGYDLTGNESGVCPECGTKL